MIWRVGGKSGFDSQAVRKGVTCKQSHVSRRLGVVSLFSYIRWPRDPCSIQQKDISRQLTEILKVDEGTAQDEQPGQSKVRLNNHVVLRCEGTGNLAIPNVTQSLEHIGTFARRDEARCGLEGCAGRLDNGGRCGRWTNEGRCAAESGGEKCEDGRELHFARKGLVVRAGIGDVCGRMSVVGRTESGSCDGRVMARQYYFGLGKKAVFGFSKKRPVSGKQMDALSLTTNSVL